MTSSLGRRSTRKRTGRWGSALLLAWATGPAWAAPPPDDRRHRAKVQARAKAVPVQAHERRSLRPLLAALGKVLDGVDVRAVAVVQRYVERRVRDGSATLIAPPPDAMVEQRELRLAEGAAHRALA